MSMSPQSLAKIREARLRLITEGLLNSQIPAALVPTEIEQSWRRSVSHGVNPSKTPSSLPDFESDPTLLNAANRVLDQWADSLDGSHMTLVLADKEGRIIARRATDARDAKNLDHVNAVEGSDFSERSLGTNGLGTSLEGHGVVLVRGTEHFNDSLAQIACSGAPITHPLTGRVIASLSLAAPLDTSEPLIKAMTRQAGLQIIEAIERLSDSRDLDLARTYRRMKSSRRPVLVFNSETVMTDLPALAHLDAEFHALLWEELRRHSWSTAELNLLLPMLGTEATVRRLTRDNREEIFAIEFSGSPQTPSPHAALLGKPIGETPGGSFPDPASGSLRTPPVAQHRSYQDVSDDLTAAAADPGLLRIVGPSGVGKRFQASLWLRKRTGKEPVIFNAQDDKGESLSWEGIKAALKEERGVIIAAMTGLLPETEARIDALAYTVTGDARIVLTELPAENDAQEIATQAITMPALAELHRSIPAIAREVSAEIFPDAPEPKFSTAALQRLLAWPWPANTAELRQLLAGLPQIPLGQLIQVRHLPPPLRQDLNPAAGRYEQAERDAIISALQEAGGNKSEAAEILGIGRTTLYRKIRVFKIEIGEWAP